VNDIEIVQLVGKVTDLDWDVAYAFFKQADDFLTSHGFRVINPMKIVPKGTKWAKAMDICLTHMEQEADAIYLLENWRDDSKGAAMEKKFAEKTLKIPVFYELEKLIKL